MVTDENGKLKDNPRFKLLATRLFRFGRSYADIIAPGAGLPGGGGRVSCRELRDD